MEGNEGLVESVACGRSEHLMGHLTFVYNEREKQYFIKVAAPFASSFGRPPAIERGIVRVPFTIGEWGEHLKTLGYH